jgi:hypothetical protein
MRRLARTRGLGTGLVLAALASHPSYALSAPSEFAAASPRVDVGECVDYTESDDESSFSAQLHSRCERPLRCELRWTLTCGGERTPRPGEDAYRLKPGDTHVTRVSATGCGDEGWSVDALTWSCVATQR